MNAAAFTELGFAAGMVKAAAGDNQPGPMPQQPAPPDSHRKRNVALGAALIGGGILSAKGVSNFARGQSQLATQVVKQNRSAVGKEILGRMRKGDHAAHEATRFLHQSKQPITGREKVKALAGHYAGKAKKLVEPSRELKNQRWMAEHGVKDVSPEGKAKARRKTRNKILAAAAAPVAVAGGAIAGGSAASRAREAQSDDQPGLGRGVG